MPNFNFDFQQYRTEHPTIKLFYLRDLHRRPVACVATEKNSQGRIAYALSTCSYKDSFDHKKGRMVAAKRLAQDLESLPSFELGVGVKIEILRAIASDHGTHTRRVDGVTSQIPNVQPRARDAAQWWLDTHLDEHGNRRPSGTTA